MNRGLFKGEFISELIFFSTVANRDRKVVKEASDKKQKSGENAVAIELDGGTIITGRETNILRPTSSLILNTIKHLANIDDDVDLMQDVPDKQKLLKMSHRR